MEEMPFFKKRIIQAPYFFLPLPSIRNGLEGIIGDMENWNAFFIYRAYSHQAEGQGVF